MKTPEKKQCEIKQPICTFYKQRFSLNIMTALAATEHFCNVGGTFIKWLARLCRKAISYEVRKFKLFIQRNSTPLWAT